MQNAATSRPESRCLCGPVGLWIPFHPDAYKTGRVEYLEKELNQLMHEKNQNEEQARLQFDQRVKESVESYFGKYGTSKEAR